MKKTLLTLSILAALGTLTACGGGSGSSSGSTPTNSRSVSGVITAVNGGAAKTLAGVASGTTVTVNGVTYALETDATIDVDDSAGSEADLAEGQVVTLEGSVNDDGVTGTATMVEFDDETQGYVLANDLATGTLNVMGKVVHVSATTKYEGGDLNKATIDLLAAGDVVEVSGYPDANGEIIATRIEGKSPSEDIEVKGVVSNATASTFNLGTLIVDFSSADVGDLPGGAPTDGLYVEVKAAEDIGALNDNGDGTYTLVASKVELQDGGDMEDESAAEGDEMEISGVLTVDAASGVASVNGQTLAADANSGITEGQIAALEGQLVVVEGYIDNGNLVVVEIELAD